MWEHPASLLQGEAIKKHTTTRAEGDFIALYKIAQNQVCRNLGK